MAWYHEASGFQLTKGVVFATEQNVQLSPNRHDQFQFMTHAEKYGTHFVVWLEWEIKDESAPFGKSA